MLLEHINCCFQSGMICLVVCFRRCSGCSRWLDYGDDVVRLRHFLTHWRRQRTSMTAYSIASPFSRPDLRCFQHPCPSPGLDYYCITCYLSDFAQYLRFDFCLSRYYKHFRTHCNDHFQNFKDATKRHSLYLRDVNILLVFMDYIRNVLFFFRVFLVLSLFNFRGRKLFCSGGKWREAKLTNS